MMPQIKQLHNLNNFTHNIMGHCKNKLKKQKDDGNIGFKSNNKDRL